MIKNLVAAGIVALIAAGACFAWAGGEGLRGSLVGSAVVAVLFAVNPTILGPVVRAMPEMSLVFALTFFVTKVVAIAVLLMVLTDPDGLGQSLDTEALTGSVIAATLTWMAVLTVEHRRARQPLYDLGP